MMGYFPTNNEDEEREFNEGLDKTRKECGVNVKVVDSLYHKVTRVIPDMKVVDIECDGRGDRVAVSMLQKLFRKYKMTDEVEDTLRKLVKGDDQ